jgi:germination protein M
MTRPEANLLTVLVLGGLGAGLALTAPRWARFLRQPITSVEDETASPASGAFEGTTGDGSAEAHRTISVKLYFPSPQNIGLLAEERSVPFSSDLSRQIRSVVEELVKGSQTGLLPPVAPETKVIEVFVTTRGVAYVDVSKEGLSVPAPGSEGELLSVYAIVNTVGANFPAVKRVQILVEDKPVDTLAGHVDLSRPLLPDMTLLAQAPISPETSPAPEGAPSPPSPAAVPRS